MSTDNDKQNALALDEVGDNAIESKETEGLSQGKIVLRKFLRHKGAMISIVVLVLVAIFAFSAQGFAGIPGWWKFANDQVGAPPGLTTGPDAVWLNFHQPGIPANPCALKAKMATSTRTTMEIIAPW